VPEKAGKHWSSQTTASLKISELPRSELVRTLRRGELLLDLSPFVARVKSDIETLADDIHAMYADFKVLTPDRFSDFHVDVSREAGFARWFKPGAVFKADGRPFFVPLTLGQAFACLEWGLNWCITATMHNFLVMHAAVIERGGKCAIMPAPPGSGKSTLCAGLVMRGWRLLSDELALYDIDSGLVYGMARPINLKNASIEVIRKFAPHAILTKPVPNTSKGTVALLRPPQQSVLRVREPAQPAWVVLPNYQSNAQANMLPQGKSETLMLLAEQTFNYHIHGLRGFDGICKMLDTADCFRFSYSSLDDADAAFSALLGRQSK